MVLDNPPNQIAWRRALSSGKHLELLEDSIRKFHCSLHNSHCPMSPSACAESSAQLTKRRSGIGNRKTCHVRRYVSIVVLAATASEGIPETQLDAPRQVD